MKKYTIPLLCLSIILICSANISLYRQESQKLDERETAYYKNAVIDSNLQFSEISENYLIVNKETKILGSLSRNKKLSISKDGNKLKKSLKNKPVHKLNNRTQDRSFSSSSRKNLNLNGMSVSWGEENFEKLQLKRRVLQTEYDEAIAAYVESIKTKSSKDNFQLAVDLALNGSTDVDKIYGWKFSLDRIILEADRQNRKISENAFHIQKTRLLDSYINQANSKNLIERLKAAESNTPPTVTKIDDLRKNIRLFKAALNNNQPTVEKTTTSFWKEWFPIISGCLGIFIPFSILVVQIVSLILNQLSNRKKDKREETEYSYRIKDYESRIKPPSDEEINNINIFKK